MIDLKVILEKYPRCLERQAQLAGLLRDLYPNEKRQVNLVLAVYQCGIASRIGQMQEIDAIQMRTFVQQLDNEYGLQEQYAIQGIELWASAYGIKVGRPSASSTQAKSGQSPTYSQPTAIVHDPNAFSNSQIVTGVSSDYELKTLPDGTSEIVKFIGFDQEDMVVPNIIDGRKVTGIGKEAFANCKSMIKIIVSDGIQYIGDGAFYQCSQLAHILLPTSLTVFGEKAFFKCARLKKIDLPNGITEIPCEAFSNCDSLTSIILPDYLRIIRSKAFSHTFLEQIICPDSLREIEGLAFYSCSNLKNVILNEGLEKIGLFAFEFSNLKEVIIPATVSEIGMGAFDKKTILYCYARSRGLTYARGSGNPMKNAAELIK